MAKSPLWKQLINLDANTREFTSTLTEILGSQAHIKHLAQIQGEEAIAFIDGLDRFLSSCNGSQKLNKKCLVVLRKTCGQHGILPTSHMLFEGLEKTKDCATTSGGFADVWEGTYNGCKVAIKALRVYVTDDSGRVKKRFCKEALLWKRLSHPNVLPFLGISINLFPFCMVSTWMRHGNIVDYIRKHPKANRLELLADVGRGLQYLQDIDFVHGDLKGANILINDAHRACLADFGLMTILSDPNTAYDSNTSMSIHGTTRWMAPELFDPEAYGLAGRLTRQTDIYALGMVVFEVLTGSAPFQGLRDVNVIRMVISGIRPKRPTDTVVLGFSDPIWELVERCWHGDPSKRPDISVALGCLSQAATSWNPLSPVAMTIESLEEECDSNSFDYMEFSDSSSSGHDVHATSMDLRLDSTSVHRIRLPSSDATHHRMVNNPKTPSNNLLGPATNDTQDTSSTNSDIPVMSVELGQDHKPISVHSPSRNTATFHGMMNNHQSKEQSTSKIEERPDITLPLSLELSDPNLPRIDAFKDFLNVFRFSPTFHSQPQRQQLAPPPSNPIPGPSIVGVSRIPHQPPLRKSSRPYPVKPPRHRRSSLQPDAIANIPYTNGQGNNKDEGPQQIRKRTFRSSQD